MRTGIMSPSLARLKGLPNWPASLDEVQAAAFANLPLKAFRRAVAQGELPPARCLAGHRRWSRAALERRLDDETAAPLMEAENDPLLAAIERMAS